MKTSPEPLPFLVISGPPLETFCAEYNLPLERFTDRFSGDWWAFLFLCEAGPMLIDLENLLGFAQREAAGQFVEESCWIEDYPDWNYSATNDMKLAALQEVHALLERLLDAGVLRDRAAVQRSEDR